MATRTSVGNGAWSAAGTWDTGVPLDGDDVVIASGHTVTFDVDQSAFTTGVKVTITGTLNHTTTTGTYLLKAKTGASIVGAGTWNIGTSGTPIPFAAKHTITGAAGWYIDGNAGLTMTVYGAEPTYTYVKLSGNEAIGQTELSVDTDVTGDIWADGDIIRIDDINKAKETEERVIAAGGIAAGAITITAGLTAAKSAGAYIVLITRNVKIIAVGTGARTIYRVGATENKLTIGGGMFYGVAKDMIEACHYAIISGGAFSAHASALRLIYYMTISGGVFSGNTTGLSYCNYPVMTGGLFVGNTNGLLSSPAANLNSVTFIGNNNGINTSIAPVVDNCTFLGNNAGINACPSLILNDSTITASVYGLYSCMTVSVSGCTFSGNTNDLQRSLSGKLYNTTLGSAMEYNEYTSLLNGAGVLQSEKHEGVDGALKAWCVGGIVTSQVTVKPDGYTQAYLLDPESAVYPVFFTKQFSVEPGKTVNVEVQLRKDASMTYLPRVYLMASIGNPLAGATPVDTFTMTDSTNTWESDTFTIANSTNYDQDYTLWFVAQNATDNAYAAYDITTQGGGGAGGAVSIRPIQGTVTL